MTAEAYQRPGLYHKTPPISPTQNHFKHIIARANRKISPRFGRRAPQIELRFQIGEFLHRALFHAGVVGEAERQEFVGLVVILGIAHDGLLGHADDVAGGDEGAIREGEILQDFSLDRNFISNGSEHFWGCEC